ncbi:MAG: hypothetical protein H6658_07690 [Ardenticatenaceae bacterium]|nr:hypothetical protein [Ardenticatenaceae bacterium]
MAVLFFNSNSASFETPTDIVFERRIRDSNLYKVRCFCYSWAVRDLYQEWGVSDFPNQSALRVAHFQMQPAPDELLDWANQRLKNEGLYRVLLYPESSNDEPIPVLCDSVDKHFFGVAIDHESAKQLIEAEGKEVWITVVVKTITFGDDSWPELEVYRQRSDSWAEATVGFAQS